MRPRPRSPARRQANRLSSRCVRRSGHSPPRWPWAPVRCPRSHHPGDCRGLGVAAHDRRARCAARHVRCVRRAAARRHARHRRHGPARQHCGPPRCAVAVPHAQPYPLCSASRRTARDVDPRSGACRRGAARGPRRGVARPCGARVPPPLDGDPARGLGRGLDLGYDRDRRCDIGPDGRDAQYARGRRKGWPPPPAQRS